MNQLIMFIVSMFLDDFHLIFQDTVLVLITVIKIKSLSIRSGVSVVILYAD